MFPECKSLSLYMTWWVRVRSWVWDPLDDAEQDKGVAIGSKRIKEVSIALLCLLVFLSTVVIVVCSVTSRADLRWQVALGLLVMLWIVFPGMMLGLFVTHPVYWARMRTCWPRKEGDAERPNPLLLDPEDEEITL
jgi:hypothetical protein